MYTVIGVVVLVVAAILLFRATAFAARALLTVVALVGLLVIAVPLLMAS